MLSASARRTKTAALITTVQVEILFRKGSAFALDLCKYTEPYQVVVARLERKEALKAMLADLDARTREARAEKARTALGDESMVLVPSMNWRISHDFKELKGKRLLNSGFADLFIGSALQMVQFRMNRKGVEIKSFAQGDWANGHEERPNASFIFDRPYLVVLRTRADGRPFFAMWVDNAELLQRHD
jgi:hypothetical protein